MDSSYGQPGKVFTAIGVPWGKLYRKRVLQNNDLAFDLRLKRMQDNILNMEAFYYARKIVYLDVPLYVYRWEHISNLKKEYHPEYAEVWNIIVERRWRFLVDTGMIKDIRLQREFVEEAVRKLYSIADVLFCTKSKQSYHQKHDAMKGYTRKQWFHYSLSFYRAFYLNLGWKHQIKIFMANHQMWICYIGLRGPWKYVKNFILLKKTFRAKK